MMTLAHAIVLLPLVLALGWADVGLLHSFVDIAPSVVTIDLAQQYFGIALEALNLDDVDNGNSLQDEGKILHGQLIKLSPEVLDDLG